MSNERKYLSSHPWINFQLDLSHDVPYDLWILLGAAESKCRHLAGIPLRPQKHDELNIVSLRKGVHATTAIEGNSLSEEEVQRIIDDPKKEFPKSKEYQKREVENVVIAYNNIVAEVKKTGFCGVGYEELVRDNAAILGGLDIKDVAPGEIRTHPVVVNSYRGAPAEDCDYLLRKLFDWLGESWGLSREHEIIEGILKAIIAHLYIAWIHPFGDGNGRSARMLEFRLLMATWVPLNAAHLLTSHYNDTRTEYYNALAATSRTRHGDPIVFLIYALQGFVDALDEQINVILEEQLDVTWENYVHESIFKGRLSDAQTRQRDLLLELSTLPRPILPSEFRMRLSRELLLKYRDKTSRAFNRDINALESIGMILKKNGLIEAAKDTVKAFLPICRQNAF